MKRTPKIAIIGRPNVGKSTLINRLCAHSEAIVHHEPMITRDRKVYKTDWDGFAFNIVDTGGIDIKDKQRLSLQIFDQAKKAIEESGIIIFVVDIKSPLSAPDTEIAQILRKTKKPVIFAGNKWDDTSANQDSYFTEDYLVLGYGYPVMVSAIHGINITELLDEIVSRIKELDTGSQYCSGPSEDEKEKIPTIAILGQPNSGKSTLFNNIIREERVIVDEIEGTTRDSIDSLVTVGEKKYVFIDTAGLKRDKVREEALEFYSKIRTMKSIESSDVCLVLIDSTKDISNQDRKIIEKCLKKGKSVCAVFNKIDIAGSGKVSELAEKLNVELEYLSFIPFLKISALKQKNTEEVFKMIDYLIGERNRQIPESRLTNYFKGIEGSSPIYIKGKMFKIKFMRQIKTSPPGFLVFSNMNITKKPNIIKYIENNIRQEFGFIGTPIFFKFK
jgi:GTP-binding protein